MLHARWSLTLRFALLDAIPSEFVVYSPMGSSVICLEVDLALVTETPA